MSRIVSWFATKNGRTFTRSCVGLAALTVFSIKPAFNGPLLNQLKDVVQVYKFKKPRPLPPSVHQLIEEVVNDCNLKPEQKKKLKFFYVMGHEPFHAGGYDSSWGGIIGLPFFFEDMNGFEISELRVPGNEKIDWVIEGRDLFDAVLMSDNAKKFAIMRQIYSCKTTDTMINSSLAAFSFIVAARFVQIYNAAYKTFERFTLTQRSIRYSVFYGIGFLLYRLLKDPLKHLSDKRADLSAAETGPEYLDGGIEYYEKVLLKNKALNELRNSRFGKPYDEHGNESYFLFVPKMPITKRLENLQILKKEKMAKGEDGNSI